MWLTECQVNMQDQAGLYNATILLAYAPKYVAVGPGFFIEEHQCA
jgi:hypothetical protein